MKAVADAEQITQASKSNLALTLVSLPRERRRDMTIFYAFCRVVDDIADSETLPAGDKRAQLDAWKASLHGPLATEPALASAVRGLMLKYNISHNLFLAIIEGVEMDLSITRYATFQDLRLYCYRVASVVGLVSIEIFGYRNPLCKRYAVELGMALQLTNILRDVNVDLRNGDRIYLPQEDFSRFGYTEGDLRNRLYNDAFVSLMRFQADRARSFYREALANLPPEDRRAMVAAETMREIYWRVLQRIERDQFRVFEKDYRLSKFEKIWTLAAVQLRTRLNARHKASAIETANEAQ